MANFYGTAGNDNLPIYEGFYLVAPNHGDDTFYGYEGNDTLDGGDGDDTLYGDNGDDILYGGDGHDWLDGGYGYDSLNGGAGIDTVSYSFYSGGIVANLASGVVSFPGNSTLTDTLSGIENVTGSNGSDWLTGDGLNNTLDGGYGNDTLWGMGGNDLLMGGAGDDRLDGYATSGTEYDTLYGGTGYDTFILGGSWGVSYQGYGFATIADWDGTSDRIEVIGSTSDYSLGSGHWGGTSALDTEIYFGNELIAVVQDSIDVNISQHFSFV